jgi:hypothetical protein
MDQTNPRRRNRKDLKRNRDPDRPAGKRTERPMAIRIRYGAASAQQSETAHLGDCLPSAGANVRRPQAVGTPPTRTRDRGTGGTPECAYPAS